jgi:hypothetical protein
MHVAATSASCVRAGSAPGRPSAKVHQVSGCTRKCAEEPQEVWIRGGLSQPGGSQVTHWACGAWALVRVFLNPGPSMPTHQIVHFRRSGPFEAHPDSPTSTPVTLFLDADGLCYESLEKAGSVGLVDHEAQATQATKVLERVKAVVDKGEAARRQQNKAIRVSSSAMWVPALRGARTRKMMQLISQPRSQNY